LKTYELDLLPGDLLMLDNDIEISDEYRTLFFDIETRDDTGGIEIGRDRILSICCVDDNNREFVFCEDDETQLLTKYLNFLNY